MGSEGQPKWTQTLNGKKYSFQNPLRQTFRQKKILSEFLGLNESLIHPVIFFVGDSKFKTQLPANVIDSRLGRYIKQFVTRIILPEEINRIVGILDLHMSESSLTTRDHVQSLRERHNSTTVCPNCGSDLVKRTANKGLITKSKFLGCASYPRCRFTRSS